MQNAPEHASALLGYAAEAGPGFEELLAEIEQCFDALTRHRRALVFHGPDVAGIEVDGAPLIIACSETVSGLRIAMAGAPALLTAALDAVQDLSPTESWSLSPMHGNLEPRRVAALLAPQSNNGAMPDNQPPCPSATVDAATPPKAHSLAALLQPTRLGPSRPVATAELREALYGAGHRAGSLGAWLSARLPALGTLSLRN